MFSRKDSDHAFGNPGAFNLVNTATKTGRFKTVQCLTATVIAAYTDDTELSGSGSLVGLTLDPGTVLFGDFSSIQLTSGAVRLYQYSNSVN